MSKADGGGYVKPDYWRNHDAVNERWRRIARQREKEKHLVPLVIDRRTTIYVTPGKCDEAYAEAYRRKMSNPKKDTLGPIDVRA